MPNDSLLKKMDLLKSDKDDIIRLLAQTLVSLHTRFFNNKQYADEFSDSKLLKLVNNKINLAKYFNKDSILEEETYVTFPKNVKPLKNYYDDSSADVTTETF